MVPISRLSPLCHTQCGGLSPAILSQDKSNERLGVPDGAMGTPQHMFRHLGVGGIGKHIRRIFELEGTEDQPLRGQGGQVNEDVLHPLVPLPHQVLPRQGQQPWLSHGHSHPKRDQTAAVGRAAARWRFPR